MAENQSNGAHGPPKRPPPPVSKPGTPSFSVQQHREHLQGLTPSKVRWFYQEDKKWIAFNGGDSLRIEKVFRSLPPELQSPLFIPTDYDPSTIQFPTVKGSLYEIDILSRECRPIYWKENASPIMRGTWFKGAIPGSWEPLEEKDTHKIEEGHINVVRSLGLGSPMPSHASPTNSNALYSIKVGVNRIEWHDISEVYLISETAGSRLAQKIGLGGAIELHRGYEVECVEKDDLLPIDHIVFLVHGMGQLYHGDGGIINSRKKLSKVTEKTEKRYFNDHTSEGRLEFFPIEWRTKLKLDEGIIDKITPSNLGSLRKVINDTTLDVFYYTSPFYREEIIQALRQEMNSVYLKYIERNPSFVAKGGKVSIIAHSLGSVIIHDVLTLWNSHLMKQEKKMADPKVASGSSERVYSWFWGWGREKHQAPSSISLCSEEELKAQLHEARMKIAKIELKTGAAVGNSNAPEIKDMDCYAFEFKVDNVFNIGSPLGVFLVMRGIRPRDDLEQHIMPTSVCKRIFNIYDPSDPVAYRLEPLIFDYYSEIPPMRLSQVGLKEIEKTASSKGGGASRWLQGFFTSKASKTDVIGFKTDNTEGSENAVELPKSANEKADDVLKGKNVLDYRIDYTLEQSMVEYFSAITSHQSYWHNVDFAKFVLHQIYEGNNQEEESNSSLSTSTSGEGNKL